jgi:hypothetical protein
VTVSWDICERHKHKHRPGNGVWQSNDGYLSSDSEEMETDENVVCVGECQTCKEDDEINEQRGTGETVPTKTERESTMEEESEEGYDMFGDTISENENEAEEAVYEVNNNDYFNFYETTLREEEKKNEMKNKGKNECLVTMHDEMHSYLRVVAYKLPHVHDDKNWVEMVKTKLLLMKVFEIKTTLINIRKYNPTLTREGRSMIFKITLRRMIEIGLERIVDEDNYGDLNELIDKVSSTRAQSGTARERHCCWMDYSRVRLCAIGINTIRTLLVIILDVNELLGRAREVEFYHRTLDCFMKEGVEILMREQRNRIIVSADDVTSEENHVHMVFDDNGLYKSSESSNSRSEDSETFDLRHKGICEKCQTIGIIGTECLMCEDKSCILTEPTENVLSYLKEKEETSVLGLEQLCSLMNINGADLCGRCLHLGPMGMYCRRCTKETSTTEKTPRYDSQEEILEDHEGICPMCNITGENLTVCQHCMESVFVRLPGHDKVEGSQDNKDEAEDNQVVITMEGGKSRQHGRTKTTQ